MSARFSSEQMRHPASPEAALGDAIKGKNAIIVVGTGISVSASRQAGDLGRPHPQASWSGLLRHGIEWAVSHDHMQRDEADALNLLIEKNPNTYFYISVAHRVTGCMGSTGSEHFAEWLKETVGSIRAYDRTVLDAIHAVRKHGNLLATTNYDDLLLVNAMDDLRAVTWKDPNACLTAVRQNATNMIMFLHGYWRKPDSVILDWKSYEKITRDDRHGNDIAAILKTKTWVYVGCGMNGLSDPDFGLLLERYGKRLLDEGLWDFCLVRRDQRDEFQAFFDKNQFNILAVAIGTSYDELAPFLHSLLQKNANNQQPLTEQQPFTLCGLSERVSIDVVFQDFVSGSNNPVYYMWADAQNNSYIRSQLLTEFVAEKKCEFLRVEFLNGRDTYPCNIAIYPKNWEPRLITNSEFSYLSFRARVPNLPEGAPVSVAIRVVNGLLEHWAYTTKPQEYIEIRVKSLEFEWFHVRLPENQSDSSWHLFEADGNRFGPKEDGFPMKVIALVVFELGSDFSRGRVGGGECVIDIEQIRLTNGPPLASPRS